MHEAYVPQEHEDTVPPERGFTRDGGESLVLEMSSTASAIFADFRPTGRLIRDKVRAPEICPPCCTRMARISENSGVDEKMTSGRFSSERIRKRTRANMRKFSRGRPERGALPS